MINMRYALFFLVIWLSAASAFAAKSATLSMDANGNYGINSTAPQAKLDVEGNVYVGNGNLGLGIVGPTQRLAVDGSIYIPGAGNIGINSLAPTAQLNIKTRASTPVLQVTNSAAGDYLTVTSAGNVGINSTTPQAKLDVDSLIYAHGNVGIGTASPQAAFEVGVATTIPSGSSPVAAIHGNFVVDSKIYSGGGVYLASGTPSSTGYTLYNSSGTLYFNGSALSASGFTSGGGNIYTTTLTDNVGIGTSAPAGSLEIQKQATDPLFLLSSAGSTDGDYLTVTSTGNMGINSTAPRAKLDVDATIYVHGNIGIGTSVPASGTALDIVNTPVIKLGVMYTNSNLEAANNWQRFSMGYGIYWNSTAGNYTLTDNVFHRGTFSYENEGFVWALDNVDRSPSTSRTRAEWITQDKMILTASGNLGIGPALGRAPTAKLTVYGSGTSTNKAFEVDDSLYNAKIVILDNGNVGFNSTAPSSQLEIKNNATTPLRITNSAAGDYLVVTSAGNVGIGSAVPAQNLDVKTALGDNAYGGIRISQSIGNQYARPAVQFYSTTGVYTSAQIASETGGSYQSSRLFLEVADSGKNLQPRMTINKDGNVGVGTTMARGLFEVDFTPYTNPFLVQSDGNVGIGTSAPGSTLDVKGTLRLSGATSGYVGFVPATAAGSTTYTLPSAGGSAGQALVTDAVGVLSWGSPTVTTVSQGDTNVTVTDAGDGNITFTEDGSEKMRLTGGKLGIGTTVPQSALTVGATGNFQVSDTTGAITKAGIGTGNIFIGAAAWKTDSTGVENILIGHEFTGANISSGGYNFFVGSAAGYSNTSGSNNIAFGYNAGRDNLTGSHNIIIGHSAGYGNGQSYSNNIFVGQEAGYSNLTALQNIAIGHLALRANKYGQYNIAIGKEALNQQSYGAAAWDADNIAIGYQALYSNNPNDATNGRYNTAVGKMSGYSNTTGYNNTFLGYQSGYTATPGNANTTGSKNTFVGFNAGPGTATQLDNATAIGYQALVSASNSLVLGGTGSDAVNVGINSTSPAARLDVDAVIYAHGNIGVGTFSPQTRLEVRGDIYSPLITLTDAATISVDWSLGNIQAVTLGAAGRTVTMSNGKEGGRYTLIVKQDGTGNRTVTTWTGVRWADGVAPTLSTGASKTDYLTFIYYNSNYDGVGVRLNF